MKRPAGVTASAIVAILGSVFMLLLAALAIASLFMDAPTSQPASSSATVVSGAAIIAAFAGVGLWTSIGVFRLRAWARISILVFAAFLGVSSIFGLLMTMAVPIPPEFARTESGFRT